jgi:hypothetical protein
MISSSPKGKKIKKDDFSKYPQIVKKNYEGIPQDIEPADYEIKRCFLRSPFNEKRVELLDELYSECKEVYKILKGIRPEDLKKTYRIIQISEDIKAKEEERVNNLALISLLRAQCYRKMEKIRNVQEELCLIQIQEQKRIGKYGRKPAKKETELSVMTKTQFLRLIELLYENRYVDKKTYEYREKVWDHHFNGEGVYCDDYRINWIRTYDSYGYFFDKLKSLDLIITKNTRAVHFSLHFLKNGQRKNNFEFNNGYRGLPSSEFIMEIDAILEKVSKTL